MVSIRVEGANELARRLRKFGLAVLDLSDAMSDSGRYLTDFFSGQVFASRGGIIGHPWPRLNEAYATEKARQFPGRPPLFRKGLMNRSFKYTSGRLSVEVFNEAWYFKFHQDGTKNMPARIMMDIDSSRENRIKGFVERDIEKAMGRAGV
ncbi:hypothetical protein ACWFRF_15465 [Nocardia sp. NPDC055165]